MEESLNKMRQQLTSFWEETDKKKKIRLGIIVLIVIAVVTTLILVLTSTKYEVLYGDLSLKDMGQITTKLDEMTIKWKTGDDQKSILVPAEDKSRVKIELASYGLPKEGYSFMDAFSDSSWTMTDYDKKQRMKLALESELSSTIGEIEGVHSAKVYLEEKETTNFVLNNDDTKGTASVFIVRSDNRSLSNDKVNAIRNLVAGPININPENVTVVDDEGRLLGDQEENDFMITDQFVMKQHLETRINDSIKKFLSNVFGSGNVDVMSSVKINIDSEKTTIVEFAPPIEGNEEGLIRSLEEVEEHMVGGSMGGVPGTETNVEDYTMEEDGSSRYDKVSRIINNELNEINKEIRKTPGQVESITVAVLINKDSLSEGEMTPEKQKEITELIFAATGLDTKDVQVRAEKFNKQTDSDLGDIEGNNKNLIIIGIIALILLVLIIVTLLYIRSKSKESEEEQELERLLLEKNLIQSEVQDLDFEAEESKMKAQIDNFIEKKPESVAQLLRNWLNE